MCVNINKAFNVLCSQSLCEVIVTSCRVVGSKLLSCCCFWTLLFAISISRFLESHSQLLFALLSPSVKVTVNIIAGFQNKFRDIYC